MFPPPSVSPVTNAPLPAGIQSGVDQASGNRMTDAAREELTRLLLAVRDAALNADALETFVYAIAGEMPVHAGADLATLLRPPEHRTASPHVPAAVPDSMGDTAGAGTSAAASRISATTGTIPQPSCESILAHIGELARTRARWDKNVLWHIPKHVAHELKQDQLAPKPSQSLLQFATAYLREHPDEDEQAFFAPFHQLAQRDIAIPDDIALAFTRGILPFETFRELVANDISPVPVRPPAHLDSGDGRIALKDAAYWKHSLAAICSPLAIALLDGGRMTPATLLDWAGLSAYVQNGAPGLTTRSGAPGRPLGYSEPETLLLANWTLDGFNVWPTRNAALVEDPEKLRALARHFVPFQHIEDLLSLATSVDWPALGGEMDRVAAQYTQPAADISVWERLFFYSPQLRWMNLEQVRRVEESRRELAPYILLRELRDAGRLDAWTLEVSPDGTGIEGPHLRQRTTQALFDKWTAQSIPAQQQQWMGQLMAQGFNEALALDITKAHAKDFKHLDAWFTHGHGADLGYRLDNAMKDAVKRWLSDPSILPDMLALMPAMIQSDMGVERIDQLLQAQVAPLWVAEAFDPDYAPDAPRRIWYGLTTPDMLYKQVVGNDEWEDGLTADEEQKLLDESELRRQAAEIRDRLRRFLHAMEALSAEMRRDTPHARQCERYMDAWRETVAVLNDLLQPSLEIRLQQHPAEIADMLTKLSATLAFQLTSPREPSPPPGHMLVA